MLTTYQVVEAISETLFACHLHDDGGINMSPTGHLAIGFAAKKYAPKIPLAVFLVAAYVIDLIYFIFLALGIDKIDDDPWSHSMFMAIIWSVSAGLIAMVFSRKPQSGLVMGLVVFSHWILDVIVWDNVPIFFNKTLRVGLGLYNKIGFAPTDMSMSSGTVIATSIELGMLMIGLAIYIVFLRKSRRENRAMPSS